MKSTIISTAKTLGFALVGVTAAEPVDGVTHLQCAIEENRIGAMAWLARNPEARCDPRSLLTGAKSVICCALGYGEDGIEIKSSPLLCKEGMGEVDRAGSTPPILPLQRGGEKDRRARFARGADYHLVVREKLEQLWDAIRQHAPDARAKLCVDSSPIMEKALAARAGLGWIGGHTLLLNRELGSWFVLGEIITDIEIESDAPVDNQCGDCRACIDACPTKALLAPRMLDARRCISYLTIERGCESRVTSHESRYSYGCDLCQEACPHNRTR